ncbi:MAG: hypothetical protein R3C59_07185 [Planctomycetaceae bacterium]
MPASTDLAAVAPVDDVLPVKLASQHLPNPVKLHPKVISGGLPEGDAAFQELADLGIRTVISVDGMTPDVATAKRHGLSYVHLPHGYDGIPGQRIKELAKAVHDLPGPIYIHCHHGKHRSPAAASVACVSAGLIPPEMAVSVLELAGTNPGYRGLFQAAQEAAPFEQALLNELQVEFQEVQKIPPMAEAMVHLSHAADHLKLIAEAGWKSPVDHPDLEPAHEALLLRELFTEVLRTEEVQQQPEDFQHWLRDSEASARELETQLNTWNDARQSSPSPAAPPAELATQMERILANCKACHVSYRDVPLSEKP